MSVRIVAARHQGKAADINVFRKRVKHGPIGLDIGAASIKLLQFTELGGEPVLQAGAHHELRDYGAESEEHKLDTARKAVEKALRDHPFVGRDVVTALGNSEFQMKNLRLPRMPDEEMATAVSFEAQDRFDLGDTPAQFRHLRAGEVRHGNEIKEEVIAFATQDDVVRSRLAFLESLRLRPVALDLAPCAMARGFVRFLRRAQDASAVNVFVDVGWRSTSIVITHGTSVAFVKVIEVGGRQLTEAVARALNLDFSAARELRLRRMKEHGGRRNHERLTIPKEVDHAILDAQRPLVERMTQDLQLCLRYYAVTFRGHRPDSLTFVGGEASEPFLVASIGEQIDVPCLIGHPLRGIGRLQSIGDREDRTFHPAWAVACGLALRSTPWSHPRAESEPAAAPRQAAGAGA